MTTSSTAPDTQPDPFAHAPNHLPVCVPVCVPRVSQTAPRAPARRVCPLVPSPTEGTHTASPHEACPAACPKPWFTPTQIAWHYPNPNHPSTLEKRTTSRNIPCPLCGAPTHAACVTRTGTPYTSGHSIRARLANGICCHGIGTEAEAGTCPIGRKR